MTSANMRSTNAEDYQRLPQSISAMVKCFPDGHTIPQHSHERDQLLYAARGIMRLRTDEQAWIVPPDRAVYIPARLEHSVTMRGEVEMRTLYIRPNTTPDPAHGIRVLTITNLLRALILALGDEPLDYDEAGRGGAIARLLEIEIAGAGDSPLYFPLPRDPRLQRLCAAILDDPADRRNLDAWSQKVGASPRTLARLFERDCAMGFNAWRQRVRFYSALEALSDGAAIERVAHAHGYRSVSAFSAAFRKVMGVPPSKVRTVS